MTRERKNLTDKAIRFCKNYAQIGSKTLGNGAQAAIAAGYSKINPARIAFSLLERDNVQAEIARIELDNSSLINLTPDWVRDECYVCYRKAVEKRDFVAARAFLELVGKCVGAFVAKPEPPAGASSEPGEPDVRRAWLEGELALLTAQRVAGTALPMVNNGDIQYMGGVVKEQKPVIEQPSAISDNE